MKMQPVHEQYCSGCQLISLLTDLDVHLFDTERASRLHYARYDLPKVIRHFEQEALVHILELPLVKDCVYVVRDAIQLEFLAAGVWEGPAYRGALVVGPFISKAYQPQLLREMSREERLPLAMERQLHQGYNTLKMVDERKQDAISHLLINVFTPGMRQPQRIETALPFSERTAVQFNADLEQDRALSESRFRVGNKLSHAIEKGDPHMLKQVMKEEEEISWPYRLPLAPLRSMKNAAIATNSLFLKAAGDAGVHPLYLEKLWGKFEIQIEQAQSIAELDCLRGEMAQAYCHLVRELAIAALPSLIKEAVTYIRFHIDQPLRLNQVAETLGVHPSYLSSAFKKELGMTLTHYINTLRIEEAKYLLDHEDASVTQVALSVGYTDPNYFSKVFTKLEHVTPHDYRKRSKGNETSLQRVPS